MSEVKQAVNTYYTQMVCNRCNDGTMVPTGLSHLTYPPTYPHKCTKCEHELSFSVTYPHLTYEDTNTGAVLGKKKL